jgi:hypothetical protein
VLWLLSHSYPYAASAFDTPAGQEMPSQNVGGSAGAGKF